MTKKALILMLALEVLSLLSFKFPFLGLPFLIVIGIAVFFVTWKRLDFGIYALFGELFIGSRGRLLEHGIISLRMVVFAAVFGAWLVHVILSLPKGDEESDDKISWRYWLLLLVIGFGIINGLVSSNGVKNIFLDANGYLYLLIFPVVLAGIRSKEQFDKILKVLSAAVIVIGFKTLVLFVWFAYGWPGVATLYHWIIDFDIGEITGIVGSASRIFMQSQFYSLVGLFIFSFLYSLTPTSSPPIPLSGTGGEREGVKWIVIAAALLAIIISLSRSFWLGGFAAAVFADLVLIFYLKVKLKKVIKWGFAVLGIGILEIALLFGITQLGGKGFSESVRSRGLNPTEEAAGGARLLLLPELLHAIKKSPFIGSGFGSEVSYKSFLPDRSTAQNPEGVIVSFAFEWGYLDTVLKIGLTGLLVYLLFIAGIFADGWKAVQIQNSKFKIQNLGILSGLVALVVLNITTPYLNHPLGIGYLALSLLCFRRYGDEIQSTKF